jgi:hypothetical protein
MIGIDWNRQPLVWQSENCGLLLYDLDNEDFSGVSGLYTYLGDCIYTRLFM